MFEFVWGRVSRVSTLHGVPGVGWHQLLPMHLWISGETTSIIFSVLTNCAAVEFQICEQLCAIAACVQLRRKSIPNSDRLTTHLKPADKAAMRHWFGRGVIKKLVFPCWKPEKAVSGQNDCSWWKALSTLICWTLEAMWECFTSESEIVFF